MDGGEVEMDGALCAVLLANVLGDMPLIRGEPTQNDETCTAKI